VAEPKLTIDKMIEVSNFIFNIAFVRECNSNVKYVIDKGCEDAVPQSV